MIEVLDAAHLSASIGGDFQQRGGIMLVGPPETLRTTMIELALKVHPDALLLGDVNMNTLTSLKEGLTSGRYATLGFLDYQKIHERHSSTASNIEGTLRQLMEEGFTRTSHEDPTMPSTRARALVIAAVVESFFSRHRKNWSENGYMRRWLVCLMHIDIRNKRKITDAISAWKKLEFDGILRRCPVNVMPCDLKKEEDEYCKWLVREQMSMATPFALMKKIYAVLKWKHAKTPKQVRIILDDFAPCLLNSGGAHIDL